MIYIITIMLTVLFSYFANIYLLKENKYDKRKGYIFLALSMVIPCLLAGLRAVGVGADTVGYLKNDFNLINSNNFTDTLKKSNEEIGFISLVFLADKIFNNINWVMFVIEFVILLFVYKYAFDKKNIKEATSIIAIYMILCYGESLCTMRQHISLAILLYSTNCLNDKKYGKCLILWILAILFHATSIIYILIYILLFENNNIKISKLKRNVIFFAIIAIVTYFTVFLKQNILLAVKLKVISERYLFYVNSNRFVYSNPNYITTRLLYDIIFICLFIILWKKEKDNAKKEKDKISIIILIINLIFYVTSRKYIILSRFATYFFNTAILINPNFYKQDDTNRKINIYKIIFYLLILSNFVMEVFINSNKVGGYNLYPYKFFWK